MSDNNNIILVTNSDMVAKSVLTKLVLLRENDKISTCSFSQVKNVIKNATCTVMLIVKTHDDSDDEVLRAIKTIKQAGDKEVLLLIEDYNSDFILKAYDSGIYDYLLLNSSEFDYMIKTVNGFRLGMLKQRLFYDEKFLNQLGAFDNRSGLYQYKYLKEIFVDLSDNLKIRNGTLTVLSLDDSCKTKVSSNRLALAIKSSLRQDDIAAVARGGKFYLILPNIDVFGTKSVLNKLQDKMGAGFKIHSGISTIGKNSFVTIEKLALDGLTSAIQKEELAVCLEHSMDFQNAWLEDDELNKSEKGFKLFKNVFNNKMNNTIIPIFYRYKKEFETKLTNTEVSQYANDIECVFCLKNENIHSELTMRYNGFAKFKIEITHTGLESAENSKLEIPLSGLTDKFLISLLNQLKNEYKQTAYKKGN